MKYIWQLLTEVEPVNSSPYSYDNIDFLYETISNHKHFWVLPNKILIKFNWRSKGNVSKVLKNEIFFILLNKILFFLLAILEKGEYYNSKIKVENL